MIQSGHFRRRLEGLGVDIKLGLRETMQGRARVGALRLNDDENPETWRNDIDALLFKPDGHQGSCVVHRRPVRRLLGFSPAPEDCETFFRTNEGVFRAAASARILRENVARGMNFHLTSRDVMRQMKY